MNTFSNRRTIRSVLTERHLNQNRAPVRQLQNPQAVAEKLRTAMRMIFAR